MRHPGLQFQNRMRALSEVLYGRTMALARTHSQIAELNTKLEKLRTQQNTEILSLKEAEALQTLLIQHAYSKGLYPWGLPEAVTLETWFSIVMNVGMV